MESSVQQPKQRTVVAHAMCALASIIIYIQSRLRACLSFTGAPRQPSCSPEGTRRGSCPQTAPLPAAIAKGCLLPRLPPRGHYTNRLQLKQALQLQLQVCVLLNFSLTPPAAETMATQASSQLGTLPASDAAQKQDSNVLNTVKWLVGEVSLYACRWVAQPPIRGSGRDHRHPLCARFNQNFNPCRSPRSNRRSRRAPSRSPRQPMTRCGTRHGARSCAAQHRQSRSRCSRRCPR